MNVRILLLTLVLGAGLLLAAPSAADESAPPTLYFYRDGQAVPVVRRSILSGDPQVDAETLLSALLTGPTPDEQVSGLASPLPTDAELLAVVVSTDEATVDLRLPPNFLANEMDAYRSDAVVEQIAKTLHPLGLDHIHVRAENASKDLVPISDFISRTESVVPATPTNDDPLPDRSGPGLDYVGQPPALGQGRPQGALSGKTVWLSAGHGWYWSDVLNRWNTQRPNTFGIVEDFANAEAVNYYLARYLWNAGADVWLVRERSMNEHEVIVDNDDGSPDYTETGVWTTSSSAGYNGGSYRYDISAASQSATAIWTPDLPEAGWYAVRAWYRHGSNRPTDARYEIHHAGGVTVVSISQEVHGQTWRYLGEYYFEAGTAGHVTLVNESDDPGQAVIADAIRFGGGLGSIVEPGGTSGEPRWEESAEYWTHYQGAPSSVYANDVTARPLYAEWETAKGYASEAANAVYISWHTNAGGGTGTNTYIHDSLLPTGSIELQDWVHAELVGDLKAGWNPAWKDRGQKSANFGEVRELTNIPGVLLEVAFHDTEDPGDADDLREPVFRQIAARGVYQGIVKYFADRGSTPVHLSPEPPTRLAGRNTGSGQVTLTWTAPPCCDGLVGDAATSYKVYQSDNGRAFDNGTETLSTTLTLTDLPPGTLRFFRVTALNEGGESFPTPVVAVRTPVSEGQPLMLIVDGFDRLDQSALIPQYESPALGTAQRMFLERMNRYDHSVEHGQALAACDGLAGLTAGLAFDGTVNEAIAAGDVTLSDYQVIDWFVGEEGNSDASLNANERALLAAYLDGGGSLLISGAELGWDLVNQGRDPAFYHDYLRAEHLGDDASTYDFSGPAGGPFDGVSGSFDDSTHGAYDVDFPDRLGAANGSTVALNYTGGTADGAAVVYAGTFRLAHFGFPLETVTDSETRADLFCAAIDYLVPSVAEGVTLSPDGAASATAGATVIYTHTLANTGSVSDTYHLSYTSSQGWTVSHPASVTLDSGLTTTLVVSVAVPIDAASGLVDRTILTATSQSRPTVFDSVTDITTVQHDLICTPRLINPGFEGGADQSAWQLSVSDGGPVFAHRDDLPPGVEPATGDWLAWLGTYTPSITTTVALTQVVALPAGEPTIDLSLAWQAVGSSQSGSAALDKLTVDLYDLSGTLIENLLTVTSASPASGPGLNSLQGEGWQASRFDLGHALNKVDSTLSGQTVQVVIRAVSRDTAFFVDDVHLTTCGRSGPDEFRALWVDAFHDGIKSRKQIDELVETAQAGNFNALVVQVRRRGDTYYPSTLDPWAPDAAPTFDALAYLVERAHGAGIQVHAWSPTLVIWSADTLPAAPDHAFNLHGPGASEAEYWLMTSYTGEDKPGNELYYLDPGHPDAADYIVALYAELAITYNLDGLHLDRVRYPELQGEYCRTQEWYCQGWGYNSTSVARFQAHTGRTDTPDPLDEQWLQWRRDQVTALVRRIYLAVTAIDPQLRVSAAVSAVGFGPTEAFGWETRAPYRQQLQDWRGWLEEGILDLALPMVYRDEDTHAAEFDAWSTWVKEHQYGRGSVVGTGLYLNSVEDSMAQWLRARQPSKLGNSGLGLSGYSYAIPGDGGTSRRGLVNAAVTEVFTQPARAPSLSWKDTPTLGHLTGQFNLTQTHSSILDNLVLILTGPESPGDSLSQARSLSIDGSGWFGAVDLVPGAYTLAVQDVSSEGMITRSVTVTVGAVASYELIPPESPPSSQVWGVYLPIVVKSRNP